MNPIIEGAKEIGRWLALFLISWIITETLKQITKVPEFYTLNIWVFTYSIPIQLTANFLLTFAGRFIDKMIFVSNKEKQEIKEKGFISTTEEKPKGLLPF